MLKKMEAKMFARRVRFGANKAESRALLADLLAAHEGDNLAHALVYQSFATERQAYVYIAARG